MALMSDTSTSTTCRRTSRIRTRQGKERERKRREGTHVHDLRSCSTRTIIVFLSE